MNVYPNAVITRSIITRYLCGITVTAAEYKLDFVVTKDTPYLALTSELWSVYCDELGGNWLLYNGTALYIYT